MDPLLLMALTFLAAASGVFAVYSLCADLFFRDRSRLARRLEEEFSPRSRDDIRKSLLFKDLGQALPVDAAEEDDAVPTWRERFALAISQAGLHWSVERVFGLSAAAALSAAMLGIALTGGNILTGVLVGLIAAFLPFAYVQYKRRARTDKMLQQLPEAFDLMARIIRAGQTMAQALQAVADEFDPPIATEFAYCYEQQNLGLAPELALRDLAHRSGLLEVKILVVALLVQQQTGGNLAQLLENLSSVVRERLKMRGKIRALTAEGRLQAWVLLALPPFMLVMLLILNRDYGQILLDRPHILAVMGVFMGIGALWIRRIVNFDF